MNPINGGTRMNTKRMLLALVIGVAAVAGTARAAVVSLKFESNADPGGSTAI